MKELSDGVIYREQRGLGLSPEDSRKIEVLFWKCYDKINPPTAYEVNMKKCADGEMKGDYIDGFFRTFNEI